jgi:hypothetical protein
MPTSAKALSLALGLIATLTLSAGVASAAEFSADLLTTGAAGRTTGGVGKLYVGKHSVRIETPGVANGYFLVDTGAGGASFVMPAQRIFMDAKQSSRLTQILVPVDPGDPCPTWQAMARLAGAIDHNAEWHCDRLPADPAGKTGILKYRATSPRGDADYAWVDPRIGFVVRFRFADGSSVALGNIRRVRQPAALFTFPADYHKFDPQQLIDRIKKSDVWVDQPN